MTLCAKIDLGNLSNSFCPNLSAYCSKGYAAPDFTDRHAGNKLIPLFLVEIFIQHSIFPG